MKFGGIIKNLKSHRGLTKDHDMRRQVFNRISGWLYISTQSAMGPIPNFATSLCMPGIKRPYTSRVIEALDCPNRLETSITGTTFGSWCELTVSRIFLAATTIILSYLICDVRRLFSKLPTQVLGFHPSSNLTYNQISELVSANF